MVVTGAETVGHKAYDADTRFVCLIVLQQGPDGTNGFAPGWTTRESQFVSLEAVADDDAAEPTPASDQTGRLDQIELAFSSTHTQYALAGVQSNHIRKLLLESLKLRELVLLL